jgi:hypothetical protein
MRDRLNGEYLLGIKVSLDRPAISEDYLPVGRASAPAAADSVSSSIACR